MTGTRSGRGFDCAKCTEYTKRKRRCGIDGGSDRARWDFKAEDDPQIFPIMIHPQGGKYGFCPAKALWDPETVLIFRILTIAAETGAMWSRGGIEDQPVWFIELLSWFLPMYDKAKFSAKATSILGDGKTKKAKANGGQARLRNQSRRR